jgi:hypothetical protein
MVNYENSKVYKIEPVVEHLEEDIYIGSTTKKYLSQRMDTHRRGFKCWKNGKRTKVMSFDLFDKYGVENCQIILLETVNCNTKDELLAREAHYIKTLKCVNKCIPNRTYKEWYDYNKQEITEKNKKYKEKHKVKIVEYQKQYRNDNIEKLKIYKTQYYNDNKQEILEKQKQYGENNKEKISQMKKIKVHCDVCDCDITKCHLSRHNRTLTHQNNLKL